MPADIWDVLSQYTRSDTTLIVMVRADAQTTLTEDNDLGSTKAGYTDDVVEPLGVAHLGAECNVIHVPSHARWQPNERFSAWACVAVPRRGAATSRPIHKNALCDRSNVRVAAVDTYMIRSELHTQGKSR